MYAAIRAMLVHFDIPLQESQLGISKQIIFPMIGHVIFHAVILYFKVQVQKGGL